ncbi:MAG: pilus assembly protein PilP [Alysiella sp.]|uniref:pilus assembly protein PilP n=1 Tax=Alysiella sp. TaxID=1872483 RepID=UPI0026DBA568|nr:pilus assembly protein PilP [Alysiella sp.]MDO4434175.1 pilus assembly protein PilP [Alysiella sp.]
MKQKILILSSLFILAACTEDSNLQEWMQAEQLEAKKKVRPVQQPESIEAVTYYAPQFSGPHAFNIAKLKAAFQNSNAPDMNRAKELLENYSLENLKFVGTIGSGSNLSALIEVEGHVYTVKPGNHLGQNYGKISKITTDKIEIIEVVEDAQGNWGDRPAELILAN